VQVIEFTLQITSVDGARHLAKLIVSCSPKQDQLIIVAYTRRSPVATAGSLLGKEGLQIGFRLEGELSSLLRQR